MLTCLAVGCRDAKGGSNAQVVKVLPSSAGSHGCTGSDQAFTPPQVASAVPLTVLSFDGWSQLAAAKSSEVLYASGQGASVVRIDVSGPIPVETAWVMPGTVDALLASGGVLGPARLSSLALRDGATLLAMEHASNTLIAIDLSFPDSVAFFAGLPSAAGGFADGLAVPAGGTPAARFSFAAPGQICPTAMADGSVFVCDSGNHAIRRIAGGLVTTSVGQGTPFFADGSAAEAGLDTPVGLIASCSGRLIVSESGAAGQGGHRVRQLLIGPPSFFGSTSSLTTLVGDGQAATLAGDGLAASLFAPRGLCSSSQGDSYWIDAGSGILRRLRGAQQSTDCPLWSDCQAALLGGGDFTPNAASSAALTAQGVLYVLDPGAGSLLRVTP